MLHGRKIKSPNYRLVEDKANISRDKTQLIFQFKLSHQFKSGRAPVLWLQYLINEFSKLVECMCVCVCIQVYKLSFICLDQQAKSDSSNSSLDSLTTALRVYSSDLTRFDGNAAMSALALIKLQLENHIKISLESGLKKEDVSKQLTGLATNALIPVAINQWCFDKLDEVYFPREPSPPPPVTSSCAAMGTTTPPLFSEDTVYHAALCCLLVKSSEDGRRDIFSQFGHEFNSFSFVSKDCFYHPISISQVKDIIYIAFSELRHKGNFLFC